MYKLTAADFADTGQWRLLLRIGSKGLKACLENTLHPEIELQQLCEVKWDTEKGELVKQIEETVYDNPRLLDDFATRIILYAPCTLMMPRKIAEGSAGSEADLYNKVYEAEPNDIFTDTLGNLTAVWSLGTGLKSFLMRTFPGARITCNLMEMVRESQVPRAKSQVPSTKYQVPSAEGQGTSEEGHEMKNELREGKQVFKEVREGEVDLVLMKDGELLSASTQEWKHPEDIETLEKKLMEAYEDY